MIAGDDVKFLDYSCAVAIAAYRTRPAAASVNNRAAAIGAVQAVAVLTNDKVRGRAERSAAGATSLHLRSKWDYGRQLHRL